jgi:TetR/AcrR family transcriptional regulator, transcriptional repressor of bet genes
MSDTPPRSQTQTDRRRTIAEAALRVLGREGHAGLTARKVAAESGMALGHISYHFNGMDEVLAEAYRLLSARLRTASDDGDAKTPLARLQAFLNAGFTDDFLTPSHIRTRIDLWSAAAAHPAVAETELALYSHYRAQLETLLAPLLQANRIPALTDTIMATLDGLWLDWMRRRNRQAVENGLEVILELVSSAKRK